MKSQLLAITFLLSTNVLLAERPVLSAKQMDSPPPRIIRTCCSFGSDMKMMGIPGLKITEIIGIGELGKHKFLGDKKKREGNGIIYTRNGGFIDMGHVRDQADWTAYLFNQIVDSRKHGKLEKILGYEGGQKALTLSIPKNMSDDDARQLAGKIAYDLSVWHEIATWYGASSIPFVPERFSSFSVEDAYSNLLGVTLGIMAIKSDLPYGEAMTNLIIEAMDYLDAVKTLEESINAMEAVRDIWWTRSKKLPSKKVLLERQLNVFPSVEPLLINDWSSSNSTDYILYIPDFTQNGDSLSNYYELSFKLNQKVPFRKLFPERKKRRITQTDFIYIISQIKTEIHLEEQKQQTIAQRKLVKAARRGR